MSRSDMKLLYEAKERERDQVTLEQQIEARLRVRMEQEFNELLEHEVN